METHRVTSGSSGETEATAGPREQAVTQRERAADVREAAVDAREVQVMARELAHCERENVVRSIVTAAAVRDEQAEARDWLSSRSDLAADLEARLKNANDDEASEARQVARYDRTQSGRDRTAAAHDRHELAHVDMARSSHSESD